MIDDYIVALNRIVKRIRRKQSNSEPAEKRQSWSNFLEELRILDLKCSKYKNAQKELCMFDPEERKAFDDKTFPDRCTELQYKLVESSREFHLQIYTTMSSFIKFFSTTIASAERRDIKTSGVSSFYNSISLLSHLPDEIEALQKSYEFRVFITHPSLYKNYDWMTFQSQIIYFHPTESPTPKEKKKELKQMLKGTQFMRFMPILNADDFKCPPDPDISYQSLLSLVKNVLRKFCDS